MLLSRSLAFLLLRRCSSLYAYSSGDDLPPSVWRGLCTHPITLLTNIHTLHTSLHVRMILLFTPSIAIGTQQPHNSSNTEHNPVILNRHSISLPILRLLFNLLLLLKQRQPHFFGWERCCGEPQHYFSHSLIIRSSSIYSVSQLFFALILTQIWLQIFQIPLVRSLCDFLCI